MIKNIECLYLHETFEIDEKMIAVISLDKKYAQYGRSIIIHAEQGVFLIDRTTKQLMNTFNKINRGGILYSKVVAEISLIKRNIPLVNGTTLYMPMTGSSKFSADWIGLHMIEEFKQTQKIANFTTIFGEKINLDFPQGNLSGRLHDACYFSEFHIDAWIISTESMHGTAVFSAHAGLVRQFVGCNCATHLMLPKKYADVTIFTDSITLRVLKEFSKDDVEVSFVESYKVKLRRLSKMRSM
ncbi:hypothetical protein [Companilactobacillus mishanensis]|uniref:Uncharacterized protein n=1 Tax=Companilactobacillus mishanensis TaxID=2486008 RepID=A0A5P0ZJZ0_9LACO|nr:hypothetical protein [Companilactobacillus mishanensis]MQS53410.1 hypothetical protein [Companilactobacillus mishanensis]